MQRAALKLALVTPLGVPRAAGRIDYAVMKGGFIKWESRTEDWPSGRKYYHQQTLISKE